MDILNSLTKEYEIKSYEVNVSNQLKPSTLLHLLEDVAYESAESLGFGYSAVYSKGLAWFVVKYRIELSDTLKAWEKVKIKTWPVSNKGITCRRDFEIYKEDVLIGKVASLWAVVDINSKRLLNPFKTLNFPELIDVKALKTDFSKVDMFETPDFERDITIRFDDIDLNGHVNNSNYISWAQDTMGVDFIKNHTPKKIDIDYKKEATSETKLVKACAAYNKETKTSLHSLKKEDNEELANIKIEWM